MCMEAVASLVGGLDQRVAARLRDYLVLLRAEARRLGLVSRAAEGDLGAHVVDSAALLTALGSGGLPAGAEIGDLGSGGGLPGAVVAVLRPDVRVVAVDARNSKIVFLKQVQRELPLPNLEVVHGRIESLVGQRSFGLAVSRALGSVEDSLASCLRLLRRDGGSLVLFKGPRWQGEQATAVRIAEGDACELGWVRKVALPGLGRSTWFVEFHVKQQ